MLPVSAVFRFVPCNPSFQMVLSPALGRFLMCVHCLILRVNLEIVPGNLCAALSSSEFSLQTWAALTFLDFPIHFFNSQRLLSSADVLPPCSAVWKLGSNCRAHLVSFLSLRVHCVLPYDRSENLVPILDLFFCCFRQEGKSGPCYSNLTWSRCHYW